jgi:hypothetical protein
MSEDKNENQAPEKKYEFSVDGNMFFSMKQHVSGAEIREIAHIDPSVGLFLEIPGEGHDRQITDSTSISLKEHEIEKFYTVPPATFGQAHEPF